MATLKVTNIKNESFAGDQLYLKTDGKIGIGTSSPTTKLTLRVGNDEVFEIQSAAQKLFEVWKESTTEECRLNIKHDGSLKIHLRGNGNSYFNGGNVGIGTASPDTKLEINGGADAIAKVTGTTTAARLDLKTNSHHRFIQTLESDGALRVYDQTNASERVRIDSSGRMIIGHSSSMSEGCLLQVARTNDNTVELFGFSANSNGARVNFTKSRNGTIGTNTLVQDGDALGELHFRAANGVDQYYRSAEIKAEIDGTPGASSVPGRLIFATTASGATTQTERMRIKSDGDIEVGGNLKTNNLPGRNIVINGSQIIDQRNDGTAVTADASGEFGPDRFKVIDSTDGAFTVERLAITDLAKFTRCARITVTTADASLSSAQHYGIFYVAEGHDISHLNWGGANAQTATLSFWARSSVAGDHSVSIRSANGANHYQFKYTLAANTWTYVTKTLPGPTGGGFSGNNTNGRGLDFIWGAAGSSLESSTLNSWHSSPGWCIAASGAVNLLATNGATFDLTGVQFEKGSIATEFEDRLYSEELARCQRYYYLAASGASKALGLGVNYTASEMHCAITYPVTMRTTPTLDVASGTNYYEFIRNGSADWVDDFTLGNRTTDKIGEIYNNSDISGTAGHGGFVRTDNASAKVAFSAEL